METRQPKRKLHLLALLVVAACAAKPDPGLKPPPPVFDFGAYRALVEALSSPEMEGRGVATAGNQRATELLERAFREAGLEPGGAGGSFRQCFRQPVSVQSDRCDLEVNGKRIPAPSLSPAAFSSSGTISGDLVFAGYGIHAPAEKYDDYKGLDANGKILVLLRYEPREKDPQSPLNGDKPSRFSELRRKVFEAKSRGAKAVLLIAPPRPGEEPDTQVPSLIQVEAESEAGIPVAYLLPAVLDGWLQDKGRSLAAVVAAIDRDFASVPIPLGRAAIDVHLQREERELCNVVGLLPGAGRLASEALVIGAHFDHLGFGQQGSMLPGEHVLHPGADDNASGTAGLVALAQTFRQTAASNKQPRRTLVFAAFNAEEVGMSGSSAYAAAPPIPLDRTTAMLNLDMIGHLRDGKLMVMGTESGDRWNALLAAAVGAEKLGLITSGDGYGPSDHTAFYTRGVPVLHFFTGVHAEHHKPGDTADTLNYQGALQVLAAVASVAREVLLADARIAYRETASGIPLAGDSRGFGAYLGTIPDFTAMSPNATGGVLLSGVRKDGPADRAGLKGGDRILSMAGRTIGNLYDMTFVLRDEKPGTIIDIVALREGKTLKLAAQLGSRDQTPEGRHPSGHPGGKAEGPPLDPKTLLYPGENRHLRNLRQLTFGGENAEGYFSPDGRRIVFQARGGDVSCDRIYVLDLGSGKAEQVSSGKGRTTCAYFTYPDGTGVFYSSTHPGGDACPPEPDRSKGFVWALYPDYDIFLRAADGKLTRLTDTPGYDAEATACFRDGRIVFTSLRDGDLDLYLLDPGKPEQKALRLTSAPGYDGGAYFSPDCKRLVWRAARPAGRDLEDYRALLKQGLIRPVGLEIYVGNPDGSAARQVTRTGASNFAPYFFPDNRRVIFASNLHAPRSPDFDLYSVDPDAPEPDKTLERITFGPLFESFPMFSPDGKKLIFASGRNAKTPGEVNLFLADWVE